MDTGDKAFLVMACVALTVLILMSYGEVTIRFASGTDQRNCKEVYHPHEE